MQIKLGSTVLADDAANRVADAWQGPSIESSDSEHQAQTVQPIRSATGRLVPRGNALGALAFSATRVCSTLAAAADLMASWHVDCPRSGTLTVGTKVFNNAALTSLRLSRSGVQIVAKYALRFEVEYDA